MSMPDLTPTHRVGNPRCGSRDTDDSPTCGAPATWHIAWTLTPPVNFSLVCDQHMTQAQRSFVYTDRHPAAVACDMPGTGWAVGDPSFCVVPSDESDRAFAAREQPTA